MKTFRELVENNRKIKFMGTLRPWEKKLYTAYIKFLMEHYKNNFDIEISIRKPKNKFMWGWIDLIGLKNKKYKIVVEYSLGGLLGKIGHEFTHIHQFIKGDLDYTDDEKDFIWKKKINMSIKEYNNINDFNEYKKVPWEKEAYKMQDKLPGLFYKSSYFESLKGLDANLDFLIDNEALN